MTEKSQQQPDLTDSVEFKPLLPSRRAGFKLFCRLIIYHLLLAVAVVLLVLMFPDFASRLPVGGVTDLVGSGEVTFPFANTAQGYSDDGEIVNTVVRAASRLDRLGYGQQLMFVLIGVWLLMLPVSWVHKGIHLVAAPDHSLDETVLILPGVVASIVLVVQHSLALAFSLAGIVAGVQFRRALQDTFDALFILVAIGTGISAGVKALEISAVLTVFFTYATLYVYFFGDGLESDYAAQKQALKRMRKEAASKPRVDQNGADRDRTDSS